MLPSSLIDLDAYLRRIHVKGVKGDLQPTLETLRTLHLAHVSHIPFENLDIQLGKPISIETGNIETKLIHHQRGGYCFEQNTLFATLLRQIGFVVTPLCGRVRSGVSPAKLDSRPRTHMMLRVEIANEYWLADVGFGGEGLLLPLRFEHDVEIQQFAWRYRLLKEVHPVESWLLQIKKAARWYDLYIFTLEPQLPIDYEVANYYVSTHLNSRFVQTLTAQLTTPTERVILINRELTIDRGNDTEEVEREHVPSEAGLRDLLAARFGLVFPAGTVFPLKG